MFKDRNYQYQRLLWVGLILLSLTITSCASNNINTIAYNISKESGLMPAEIIGGEFVLRVYYRFGKAGAPLHVYLEGDGRAWLTPTRASYNPTPLDPVGLSLAAQDDADNVLYIARPCQYVSFDKNPNCEFPYWTYKRFAPEIINSVSAVIDRGKQMSQGRGIEMIGFSGGGAVAILVAAKRRDVIGIRTVAGNLNHERWTNHHKIDPLKGSLNPVDVAKKVSHIPQIHYVGMLDKVIERGVADSFKRKAGGKRAMCIQIREIVNAGHNNWIKLWARLNKMKLPNCN
jgi:hypothetical protein